MLFPQALNDDSACASSIQHRSEDAFAAARLRDTPPAPPQPAAILNVNRTGALA